MRKIVSARKSVNSTYILHGFKWNFMLEDTISVCYDIDLYSVRKWFVSRLGYYLSRLRYSSRSL
jgi:hypothetical protein